MSSVGEAGKGADRVDDQLPIRLAATQFRGGSDTAGSRGDLCWSESIAGQPSLFRLVFGKRITPQMETLRGVERSCGYCIGQEGVPVRVPSASGHHQDRNRRLEEKLRRSGLRAREVLAAGEYRTAGGQGCPADRRCHCGVQRQTKPADGSNRD